VGWRLSPPRGSSLPGSTVWACVSAYYRIIIYIWQITVTFQSLSICETASGCGCHEILCCLRDAGLSWEAPAYVFLQNMRHQSVSQTHMHVLFVLMIA
jgi:hypothetical protein